MKLSISTAATVIALVLLTLVLRFTGIRFLLPHVRDLDSDVLSAQVDILERDDPHPERDINFGFYPLFLSGLAVAFHDRGAEPAAAAPLQEHLDAAGAVLLCMRRIVAAISVLTVLATWFIARRFLDPFGAAVAMAFAGASFLEQWYAQQASPHAPQASFAALSVAAALYLRRSGSVWSYLACGVTLALAIGTLQNGIAALIPFAAAVALRSERARKTSVVWVCATVALISIAVYCLYPFMFRPSHGQDAAQLGVDGSVVKLSGHEVVLRLFNGRGFGVILSTLAGYEPWLSTLALFGAVLALGRIRSLDREQRMDLLVVLAFVVPYTIVIGLYELTYARFVLPLTPYFAVLAGYAVARAARFVGSASRSARWAMPVCAAMFVAPEVYATGTLAWVRLQKDTGVELAAWITEHAPREDQRVAIVRTLDVPLLRSERAIRERPLGLPPILLPWYDYQVRRQLKGQRGFEIDAMRGSVSGTPQFDRADYVVLEPIESERSPVMAAFRESVAERGKLVLRLSPDEHDTGLNYPLAYRDDLLPRFTPWMWRTLHARCTGHVIEVYEMTK